MPPEIPKIQQEAGSSNESVKKKKNSFEKIKSELDDENVKGKKQRISDVSSIPEIQWPPSLKHYVNVCFAKCKTNIEKDQVELILKEKLLIEWKHHTIFTKDWSKEPLPRNESRCPECHQLFDKNLKIYSGDPEEAPTAMPSTTVCNGDTKIGKSSNFVAAISQQPPPPPPSSPGPADTPAFYTDIASKRMISCHGDSFFSNIDSDRLKEEVFYGSTDSSPDFVYVYAKAMFRDVDFQRLKDQVFAGLPDEILGSLGSHGPVLP